MPHSLFVSDLHLDPARPRITRTFLNLLADREARNADALYVLGDLFEAWIGDDDATDSLHEEIVTALRGLADSGVRLYIMHGNRDFLLGGDFARAAGATLLADPARVDLYGAPTLLMHGDTLCTDDTEYLKFRAMVRNDAYVRGFLAKPIAERRAIAHGLRAQSEQAKGTKAAEIMDVNAGAVEAVLRDYGYPRLIHGHTHRPARHEHAVDGRRCERWVLADWYERGEYLRCDASGCRRVPLPFAV